jgi:hypothetical protein
MASNRVMDDELRRHDEDSFRKQAALSDVFTVAVQRMQIMHNMDNQEVASAMLMALATYVQFAAPPDRWAEIGESLAEGLRRKVMIRQIN